MTLTADRSATSGADAAAIAELDEIVERQRAAFLADPYPSLEERQALLQALAGMVMGHRDADPGGDEHRLRRASDAGHGPDRGPRRGGARRVRRRAARGVDGARAAPRRTRRCTAAGRAFVQPQPKGVVGNIVPWNFPFDLSVGPLIEMLAAGNRVVIKPSEYTPACARAAARHGARDLRRRSRGRGGRRPGAREGLHPRALGSPALHGQPRDRPRDRQGGGRAARAGDARARRQVPGDPHRATAIDAESVKQVLGTKALKNGQMCITVDYCLVPRESLEDFARLAAEHVREAMPGFCASESCTGIISDAPPRAHRARCSRTRAPRGCDVRELEDGGEADPDTPSAADVDRARPARRPRPDAGGDLRPDPAGEGLRRARRGGRPRQRRRAAAGAVRLHQGRGPRRRRPAPHDVRRRMRQRGRGPRRAAVAAASAASARAARGATTASRASASSPTCAGCSCAARAT